MSKQYNFIQEAAMNTNLWANKGLAAARHTGFWKGAGKGMAIGAGVGAVANVAKNAMKSDKDPTKKGVFRSALGGAATGAATGAVVGGVTGSVAKKFARSDMGKELSNKTAKLAQAADPNLKVATNTTHGTSTVYSPEQAKAKYNELTDARRLNIGPKKYNVTNDGSGNFSYSEKSIFDKSPTTATPTPANTGTATSTQANTGTASTTATTAQKKPTSRKTPTTATTVQKKPTSRKTPTTAAKSPKKPTSRKTPTTATTVQKKPTSRKAPTTATKRQKKPTPEEIAGLNLPAIPNIANPSMYPIFPF